MDRNTIILFRLEKKVDALTKMVDAVAKIMIMLEAGQTSLYQQGVVTMAAIDDLETEVGALSDVADSVGRALDMLHQELQDALASGDQGRIQAAVQMLATQRQRIVDAVMRNTDDGDQTPPGDQMPPADQNPPADQSPSP